MKTTIGGERLGSGNKSEISMRNYERSTFDLSYAWRSTMACGTLVPFMKELALPGDNFEIELNAEVLTHPTIGPLFGSYKVQLDVFVAPIKNYNARLHMNALNVGKNMGEIKLPLIKVTADSNETAYYQGDNSQINSSCILSYLDIRGIGIPADSGVEEVIRYFNAIPYLAYADIYKQYYANKQEEIGVIIHNTIGDGIAPSAASAGNGINEYEVLEPSALSDFLVAGNFICTVMYIDWTADQGTPDWRRIQLDCNGILTMAGDYFQTAEWDGSNKVWNMTEPYAEWQITQDFSVLTTATPINGSGERELQLITFPLDNIDEMRMSILQHSTNNAFIIDENSPSPYSLPLKKGTADNSYSKRTVQEGLFIKTYQSDLFNNWISTEWIDGDNGVNELTKIDTTSGGFTVDSLLLAKKVYDVLNRVVLSGGTYEDWINATYEHERARSWETPMYVGGLIREMAFEEVISQSASGDEPLGTLAGRGVMTGKHKGGYIKIGIDQPSYIMGLISITPRVDYSQGNKWDVNLKTMDQFHQPGLDGMGFQDLITDQMAWFDTKIPANGGEPIYKSAGKQPAWINYTTNVNRVYGNFADENNQAFMVLLRRYEQGDMGILDMTTYIDPAKFNHIFADTSLSSQNFWAQIGVGMTKRSKQSSSQIPYL